MVQVVVVAWCWLLAVGRGTGISGRTPLSGNSGNVTVTDNKFHTTSNPLTVFTTRSVSVTLTESQHQKTTVPSLPRSIIDAVPLVSHKGVETRKRRPDYVELTNPMAKIVDSEEEISTAETETSTTTEAFSAASVGSLNEPDPWDSDIDVTVTNSVENSTDVISVDYLNAQNQSFTTETNLIDKSENAVLEPPKTNVSIHSKQTSQSKFKKHQRKIAKCTGPMKRIPIRHIVTSVPQTFISNYRTTASTLLKRIMADPPYNFKNKPLFKTDTSLHKDRSERNRLGNAHTGKSRSDDILPSMTYGIIENKEHRKHSTNKRISIGIPASSRVSTRFLGLPKTTPAVSPAVSTSRDDLMGAVVPDSDEYYSSYVEYPDLTSANIYNNTGYREGGVLPDPDLGGEEEIITEPDPDIILPDDSLADTDLHDHDLIDSVMYIYFGAAERDEKMAGRQVLIVGAVIALVAQFLTLSSVLRRIKTRPDHTSNVILLNSEISLTVANLIFMLGVQATGNPRHCELIAITLHYLHLVTCCFFFLNCFHLYMKLKQPEHRTRLRLYCLLAWLSPLLFVLLCLAVNRQVYEIRSYCWLSMTNGIMFSFAIPVTVFITLNTVSATLGFRVASQSKSVTDEEESHRKSLRIAVTLLPVFSAVWILGVIALESSASLVFPLLFVVGSGFLNWFVFACWLPPDLSLCRESDEDFDEDDDDLYEDTPALLKIQAHNQRVAAHDSQPLLDEARVYVCGRRDICELQMDPICTISS